MTCLDCKLSHMSVLGLCISGDSTVHQNIFHHLEMKPIFAAYFSILLLFFVAFINIMLIITIMLFSSCAVLALYKKLFVSKF